MLKVKIDFSLKLLVIFSLTTCKRFCQQAQILSAPFGHETNSLLFGEAKTMLCSLKKITDACSSKTFSSQQIKEELFQQSPILTSGSFRVF